MVHRSGLVRRSICSSNRSKRCNLARRSSVFVCHPPACARWQNPECPRHHRYEDLSLTSMRLARCVIRHAGAHGNGVPPRPVSRTMPASACPQPCGWNDMSQSCAEIWRTGTKQTGRGLFVMRQRSSRSRCRRLTRRYRPSSDASKTRAFASQHIPCFRCELVRDAKASCKPPASSRAQSRPS